MESDPDLHYADLGSDHDAHRVNTESKKRTHIRELEALGYHVTLKPAA